MAGTYILDCVVSVNFCVLPPSFEVNLFTDFLRNFTKESFFNEHRSNGDLIVNVIFNPATGQPGEQGAAMMNIQMSMPGKGMPQGKWPAAQEDMMQTMKEDDPDWKGPGHVFAGLPPGKSLMERYPPRDAM